MKNKVLIKLIVPDLDDTFDVFIPVNEVVWKIKKLMIKSISDLTNINLDSNKEYLLINKNNCKIYLSNQVIIDTDIRNATELILVKTSR